MVISVHPGIRDIVFCVARSGRFYGKGFVCGVLLGH